MSTLNPTTTPSPRRRPAFGAGAQAGADLPTFMRLPNLHERKTIRRFDDAHIASAPQAGASVSSAPTPADDSRSTRTPRASSSAVWGSRLGVFGGALALVLVAWYVLNSSGDKKAPEKLAEQPEATSLEVAANQHDGAFAATPLTPVEPKKPAPWAPLEASPARQATLPTDGEVEQQHAHRQSPPPLNPLGPSASFEANPADLPSQRTDAQYTESTRPQNTAGRRPWQNVTAEAARDEFSTDYDTTWEETATSSPSTPRGWNQPAAPNYQEPSYEETPYDANYSATPPAGSNVSWNREAPTYQRSADSRFQNYYDDSPSPNFPRSGMQAEGNQPGVARLRGEIEPPAMRNADERNRSSFH